MHAEHADSSVLKEPSARVIGCAFTVLNTLGGGFLKRSMSTLWHMETVPLMSAAQQYGAKVRYKDILVGEYFVDLLVNDVLLVELKTVKTLDDAHRVQLCLLLNFGKSRLEIKRVAHGL